MGSFLHVYMYVQDSRESRSSSSGRGSRGQTSIAPERMTWLTDYLPNLAYFSSEQTELAR